MRALLSRWSRVAFASSFAAALVALVLVMATCAPVPLGDGEKRVVVRGIAEAVILPTLDDVVARAEAMTAANEQLATTPSQANLDAAQDAWRAARIPWKEGEAFAFGPAMDLRIVAAIDQTIDATKVEMEIVGTGTLSESYVDSLGANRKGFHAIEYLLFRGDDDADVLVSLTTDAQAARRRDLLVALSQNLERKTTELRSAWAIDGGQYITKLAEPGSSNNAYPTIKAVIDTLVNESVFLSELIANNKLGKPMGTASGGTPQPELEESGPSDNSIADMAGNLRSIRNVYLGTRTGAADRGISQLVAAQSPETDQAVRDALDGAIRAVEAIPRPYRTALVEHQSDVEAAHEAVKTLKRILATEVVAVLGATLKFNDNDGD